MARLAGVNPRDYEAVRGGYERMQASKPAPVAHRDADELGFGGAPLAELA